MDFKVKSPKIRAIPGDTWPTASPNHRGDKATRTGIFWEDGKPHNDPLEHKQFLGVLILISFLSLFPDRSILLWSSGIFKILWFQRIFMIFGFAAGTTSFFLGLKSASSSGLIYCGHLTVSQGLHSCINKVKILPVLFKRWTRHDGKSKADLQKSYLWLFQLTWSQHWIYHTCME